jgi:hypothetical protein
MQEVNGEEEPMWLMPDKEARSTVSPAAKKDITPGIAPDKKDEE